ncbi:hypothetical protein BDY21DRAFT_386885 [Lineolata rhizophorae]|uniref:ubiquitinyl hydrolase 1 n=1 Tax=Lineolata rhizophorae TaxID=578093 RepID=A0A6A6NVC4_9PEZI|nr:hypothetical protein BDY21DRAFT_386885 [Lineolata rhizophorae]
MEPDYEAKDNSVAEITPDDGVLVDGKNGAAASPNGGAVANNDAAAAAADADVAPPLRADDFDAIAKRHLPPLGDLEVDDYAVHTWEITGWRSLGKREHGPAFTCGGQPWRVLFFPMGNQVEFVSFYLEHGSAADDADDEDAPNGGDAAAAKKPDENWHACVQFLLVLWNPREPTVYVTHHANHRFTADESDWGFTRFAELRKIFAAQFDERGIPMVENDCANITAYVRVIKDPTGVLWHNFIHYDSKKETGMVGLRNQGATCYLNSLLQSLYFTTAFRKAVYQIPTEDEEDARSNCAYALQRLFYLLQTNDSAVSTQELTGSFGWDSKQIFEQQDVQELSRILMERLEEKMKGTEAENALPRMFVGKMKTYISCINVEFESSRIEDFWDLQLNVSGNKNLDDSFKDYIQVETMDGENKYFAEGFGLQDAKKGVIFESFPEVLHLQLKRFEYDFTRDAMTKVNDRYEFPEIWDATPYLSDTADRSEPYEYALHGVLVHSGELNAGHYYAFIKPDKDGEFYKFDDDRVTRALKKEAIEENFGGDYDRLPNGNAMQRNPHTRQWSLKRSMNAYMLVYIRRSRVDEVLQTSEIVKPPEHLGKKFAEERALAERRRKEREEAPFYMEVQVCTEENFRNYQGFDIVAWKGGFDHVPQAAPRTYRILRATPVSGFMDMVAQDLGFNARYIRPWIMVNRQNGTVRPDQPLHDLSISCEEAANKFSTRMAGLKMYIEKAARVDEDDTPLFGDRLVDLKNVVNNRAILLFVKHWDPFSQTLLGAGTFYFAVQEKVSEMQGKIMQMLRWPEGTSFKLYEEIKSSMIEAMNPKKTLFQSELQDGDIITVQKSIPEKEAARIAEATTNVTAPDFYDFLNNRMRISFMPRRGGSDDAHFVLVLSKKMTYDKLATAVGERVGAPGSHLRFWTVAFANSRPKLPVKRLPNTTVGTILTPGAGAYGGYGGVAAQSIRHDSLYYEVLEVPLAELETRRAVKVLWLPEGITKEEQYDLLVEKNGTVEDILRGLIRKARIADVASSPPQQQGGSPGQPFREARPEDLRLVEVHASKVNRELQLSFPVLSINEFRLLYAERRSKDDDLELAEMAEREEKGEKGEEVQGGVMRNGGAGNDARMVGAEEDGAGVVGEDGAEGGTLEKALASCYHFDKDPAKGHHVPFIFVVVPGELFKDTKERLSRRTGIKGKQFEKIRFALVPPAPHAKPDYLDDDDVLFDRLRDVNMEAFLGLDHVNKARNNWNRADQIFIR